jgi:tetratricopeptide (TPR) repeat protein
MRRNAIALSLISYCAIIAQVLLIARPHDILAQANPHPTKAQPTNSSYALYSRANTPRIFDNALLDKLFGPSREARQSQARPLEPGVSGRLMITDEPAMEPNQSFIAGIKRGVAPKRAMALRLAEKGRQLLRGGEYQKAIDYLEKSLGLYASPYIYFYLADAHCQLGHVQHALNFLKAAESWLREPAWTAEIASLKSRLVADRAAPPAVRGHDLNVASVW